MNKIFKGVAVLAATAALGTGIAFASGCAKEPDKVANYTITTKSIDDVKEVTGQSGWRPGVFVIKVSVDKDGKILSYEVETNGTTTQWQSHPAEQFLDGTWFEGKKTSDITSVFGNNIAYTDVQTTLKDESNDLTAGASQTNFIYLQVAAFASANADDVIGGTAVSALTEYASVIDLAKTTVTLTDAE